MLILNNMTGISQEIVFIAFDEGISTDVDTFRIGNIDINNCDVSLIKYFEGFNVYHSDITLDADSIYYHFIPVFWPGAPDKSLYSLEFEPYFVGTLEGIFNEVKQGMTCDKEGRLYLGGEQISTWQNGQITNLGWLPPNMATRGDLTFRNGKLYLSSVQNTLVEVDLDNPMNSTVVMTFPPGTPEIHGLATVYLDCDSVETYAVGSHIFEGSTIYRIDFENNTLVELCHFDFYITGLATFDECSLPPCVLGIDLDADDSSLATGNDFQSPIACTFPVNITDEDVFFFSDLLEIDSVTVKLSGTQSAAEYLTISAPVNLDVFGNGTDNIILINNGLSTVPDFEEAIQNILYQNDDLIPDFGTREIKIVGYAFPYQSGISTAYIPISDPVISPGFVVNEVSCYGYADATIASEPVGGGPPYQFIWSTNESSELISQLDTGEYYLTITDALGCTKIDSVFVDQPEVLTGGISNPGFETVCNENGTLAVEAAGGTAPYSYSWSNNFEGELNEMLSPGQYDVTVEDANGCQTELSYQLEAGSNILVETVEFLCFGEAYDLDDEQYLTDTTFCLNFLLSNGCDSIRCYELNFYEENISHFFEEICYGDSLDVFGNYYSMDTTVSITYSDIHGCDSIIIFNLDVFAPIEILFDTIGNLCADDMVEISVYGFTDYSWSNGSNQSTILIEDSGEYEVTVTDVNNCNATNTIFVDEPELEIIWTASDPSCFTYKDGLIQIVSIAGGQGPYLFSINDQPLQSDQTFNGLSAGSYTLSVEDINKCTGQSAIILDDPDEIYIQGQDFFSVELGEYINISLTTNADQPLVTWNPDDYLSCNSCLENTILPLDSITYEVLVEDINGCQASKRIRIELEMINQLFVPNVFSPNDDGVNDVFKIYGSSSIHSIETLRVFNRWGAIIYEEHDFAPNESQSGWNGYFNNQKAPAGSYLVYVQYQDILGNEHTKVYSLTLVR